MKLVVLPFKNTNLLFTVIVSLIVFVPLVSLAQESYVNITEEQRLNLVGIFPSPSMAEDVARIINDDAPVDIDVAKIGIDESTGNFAVYIETTPVIKDLTAGCSMNTSQEVVRKGQEVTFSWETDQSTLNCTPGEDEDCGLMTEMTLQKKGVEGDSITLPIEETEVYVLSAKVTDYVYYTEDGEEPEMVTVPVLCTAEVQVKNLFSWLLWKLLGFIW